MKLKICSILLLTVVAARADLLVRVGAPQTVGQKTVIKMQLKNTFSEKIEFARATVFLINEHGKVVGRATRDVVGEAKRGIALEPQGTTDFNFVVAADIPFASTNLTARLSFTRLVLDGGKVVETSKYVQVQPVSND